jgi:hypothetical protein
LYLNKLLRTNISHIKCRFLKKSAFVLFTLSVIFSGNYIYSNTQKSYTESLLKKADKLKLHEQRYWHTLMHYKKGLLGVRSLIDDPDFFISKNGKTDPRAELEATIRSLFRNDLQDEEHPTCKFMGRYNWLKEKLNIDKNKVPLAICKDFNKLIEKIKPDSMSLVFPSGYINSPASMFGHTLLLVGSEKENKLLSHAINYSAMTNEQFGPLFALKGLLGFYEGYFSILPYYEKVSEYSDFEKRDIWEYKLNFNREEIMRLLYHLRELHNIHSYYYFHDENCSYYLLFLLEAARPSVILTDRFNLTVAPIDTIRAIKDEGLTNKPEYRPSKRSKILHLASKLSSSEQYLAVSIAEGEEKPSIIIKQNISEKKKAIISDLANEYLKYRLAKKKISRNEFGKLLISSLNTRSSINNTENHHSDIKVPSSPEKGHESNRISIGNGYRSDDFFQEMRYRMTYHSLIDVDEGYIEGSEIVFSDVTFRYYDKAKEFKLQKLDFIDVVSIPPTDRFFLEASWKLQTGLEQRLEDDNEHLAAYLNPGGGMAFQFDFLGKIYFMAEVDIYGGPSFDNKYFVGPGGSSGIVNNI